MHWACDPLNEICLDENTRELFPYSSLNAYLVMSVKVPQDDADKHFRFPVHQSPSAKLSVRSS